MSTLDRILDLSALPAGRIPASALAMARLSLFDWMVCGLAGREEPVARLLRGYLETDGGQPVASVFGGGRLPARAAAMVNGAASHALDYDDTHFAHVGHLSVGILPAALAAAEEVDAPATALVEAFLLGAEAATRIGMVLGTVHYNAGFHQTATAGAFGATVAAGRIFGLERDQMQAALGLCSTRASGLKSQFGTMGKPYNAGIAASNGVECASLARAGFTSADDGLEGPQGFIPTHSSAPHAERGWQAPFPETFLFEDIKYKLHACCHGTHAMIEALAEAQRSCHLSIDSITSMRLRTNPRWLSVCDIKQPRTGLEVKFSYNWLAGMVLLGIPTASDKAYTDALAADPVLAALAPSITVTGDDSLTDTQAVGELGLTDGSSIAFSHDLALRMPIDAIEAGLRGKATGLLGPASEDLWALVADSGAVSARSIGATLRAS